MQSNNKKLWILELNKPHVSIILTLLQNRNTSKACKRKRKYKQDEQLLRRKLLSLARVQKAKVMNLTALKVNHNTITQKNLA